MAQLHLQYRDDFPLLRDSDVIYFDNAATSQRPDSVLAAVDDFYRSANANPLRGLYALSVDATERYEEARKKTAAFVGAKDPACIIFTRNTTESINLAAYSYALSVLKEGDEILLTVMEHHSNILPWQMAAEKTGAKLVYLEPDEEGFISDEKIDAAISERTRICAVGMVSNVLGVTNPVRKIADKVHAAGGVMVVDGAQGAPHMKVDVEELGADFFAFSGHKMLAPFGIGVLYARRDLLEEMPPFLRGGEMIEYVTRTSATYAELPHKFEAGTVNAAGAAGLSAAIDYLNKVGYDYIREREERLTSLMMERLSGIPHVTVYGSKDPLKHCGIVTFNIDGCHPHDVSSVLDTENIAIRAGHHCAQPLMKYMGVGSTARASVYFYNTEEEVERFADRLSMVRSWLGYGD
ncbi:MAG: SufS family cysteine desulfurase [Lachnospiraceae bacterium]|nr:SufS family cysteine desulfurase [Lachnospiraceae bacterium]